jgi:hypothetical protein
MLFGFFPALIRGHWIGALVMFLASIVTYGLAGLVFAFFYNRWYANSLVKDGFQIVKAEPSLEMVEFYMGKSLPSISESGSK